MDHMPFVPGENDERVKGRALSRQCGANLILPPSLAVVYCLTRPGMSSDGLERGLRSYYQAVTQPAPPLSLPI